MHRKILAMSIAAGLLSPAGAVAQISNLTVYGKLNVDLEHLSSAGLTGGDSHLNRLSSNTSGIGLRGEEYLGDGWSALFQIESSVSPDSGAGTFAGRNTGVGLKGNYGTVILGQWDTPYKNVTARLDPFGATTFASYGAVMNGNSTITAGNAVARAAFERRQRNLIQYWLAPAAGVNARLAYSFGEEKGTCPVACSPNLWSASVSYDRGPIMLIGSYERHKEYANTATAKTRDVAYKIGGSYVLGSITLSALAEQLSFNGNLAASGLATTFVPGTASVAVLRSYLFGLTYRLGAQSLRGAYGRSGNLKLNGGAAPDTKAGYFALGYGYNLSKRTELYAIFARIDNDANSRRDFPINGITGLAVGTDPTGVGIGMVHAF